MSHILDNPIFNSLNTNHQQFSEGLPNVKYYQQDIAAFAGMEIYNEESFKKLHQQAPELFILFSPNSLSIPDNFNLIRKIEMLQFVYNKNTLPVGDDDFEIIDLKDEHVAEMIDLVNLTKPGPFLLNTIILGNYTGIFQDQKLVAMAGHRFHPFNYIEVSAVCCHPNYLGKGFAYAIIREQIKRILAKQNIPFLHVREDNFGPIKLYEKLGFETRSHMNAYVISKG
jgi:ribosomal protein S18 acetylase RimI-like enzyme